MGITERKEREKLEMRERIIEEASRIFLAEGYEKTSIRNIAESIEYSPATIYLYFKDKDELFFAIHERGFEKLMHKLAPLVRIENPLERLRETGKAYIDFAMKNPEYYDLMFIMRAPMNALDQKKGEAGCWSYGEQTYTMVQQTIQECIDKKLIKAKDAALTAMAVWSTVHGMVSLYIRDRFHILELPEAGIKKMIHAATDQLIEQLQA